MNTEIKYSRHMDLVFHLLAHMKVNNASDLYDKAYIEKMNNEKRENWFDLHNEIKALERYYNDNFNRLMLISFLPFHCGSLEEIKEIYLYCDRFTEMDKSSFIKPFIEMMEKESVFYLDFWQDMYEKKSTERQLIENFLKNELNKYSRMFNYHYKLALVYLSSSITKNGRGYNGIRSYFTAAIPFPISEIDKQKAFFQLLHEFTHQFTDDLLGTYINMNDGSHDLSENTVFLADYYLIKAIDIKALDSYLKWASPKYDLSEQEFLNKFSINDGLEQTLRKLVNDIMAF